MQYKRTNYVINKGFQYRLIALVTSLVLLSLVLFAVLSVALLLPFQGETFQVQLIRAGGESSSVMTFTPLKLWLWVLPLVMVNNLMIMILVSWGGILYTNRLAGPVYHMEQDIERVLEGQRGVQTVLRDGDRFVDLSDSLNRLFEAFDRLRENSSR